MQSGCSCMHAARGLAKPPMVSHSAGLATASMAVLEKAQIMSPTTRCAASRSCLRTTVPRRYRDRVSCITAAAPSTSGTNSAIDQRREAKQRLLQQIAGTDRGSAASSWQRALVAEAQVLLSDICQNNDCFMSDAMPEQKAGCRL